MHLQLPRKLFAAAAGGFQRHQQGSAKLRLGAGQFILGHVALHLDQFLKRHGHQFRRFLLTGAGINLEQAAILEGRGEGINGINQAALFTDFLEQARRHATTQKRAQHLRRPMHRVQIGDGRKAKHNMHLVQFAFLTEFAAGIARGFRGCDIHLGQIGEMLAHQVKQRVMIKRASAGDHHG